MTPKQRQGGGDQVRQKIKEESIREERETEMGGEGGASRVEEGVPPNKVGTQTFRTALAPPANTQTLPPPGDREEDKMGGRVTTTGSIVRVMTIGKKRE